jgi:hypothetical protein
MDSGKGSRPEVRTFSGVNAALVQDFSAFAPTYVNAAKKTVLNTSGVRVSAFDFTGDGVAEVIAGQGKGRSPKTRIFGGRPPALLMEFDGSSPVFLGGIFVGG